MNYAATWKSSELKLGTDLMILISGQFILVTFHSTVVVAGDTLKQLLLNETSSKLTYIGILKNCRDSISFCVLNNTSN